VNILKCLLSCHIRYGIPSKRATIIYISCAKAAILNRNSKQLQLPLKHPKELLNFDAEELRYLFHSGHETCVQIEIEIQVQLSANGIKHCL
jgi:hypothetical protein